MTPVNESSTLKVVSIVEALTVTGPVKPLLMFSEFSRSGQTDWPRLEHTLITTRRRQDVDAARDPLGAAALAAGIAFETVHEAAPFDVRIVAPIARAIAKAQPDIIETHDCKSHFIVWAVRLFSRAARRPRWIAFHHGYTSTSWRIALYQQLDRLTLRFADRVVTLCEPFRRMLIERGVPSEKLDVISNALKPRNAPSESEVAALRRTLGIRADECVIVCVGRLSVEKAQGDLIAACKRSNDRNPALRYRVLLIGEGPERIQLQAAAAAAPNVKVDFLGHLADPWAYFFAANIFALPSHSEGSPLVLLEAMAAGRAIVATRVGGVPEAVEDGICALLVEPANSVAFSEALARIASDPAQGERLGAAALHAVAQFTPARYAARLFAIYRR
jgi:glycosyltransferase involved in cell wall biosynthesis